MSPPLEAARREQAPPPPAKRNRWDCPTCGAHGFGQNATAAHVAGIRHYLDHHDNPTSEETP